MRRIGAHLSSAGGHVNAVTRAQDIGANTVQIFSGSPRVWARKSLEQVQPDLEALQKASLEADVRPIFVHSLYLLNLASENKELVQKSKNALVYDLKFSSYFDGAGIIVHVGSHQGRGWESSRENIRVLIQAIIDEAGVETPFLIENSAGQNGKIGSDLNEIRWLLDGVDRKQLGWCYDTCHGWAAGYRASSAAIPDEGRTGRGQLFATLDELKLWDSLRCIHANDSRDAFASGRDRHDNVLDGSIPRADWEAILQHPKLASVPLITEAPGLDGNGPDAENISRLRSLCSTTA